MPANNLIQFRKGSSTEWSSENPVLKSGEPGFSVDDNIFKIGDGVTAWSGLQSIGSATYSNYIVSTGQTSFSTATGYTVGTLELYQNGVKLVNSLDFTATDGSTVTLNAISPSGSILDYRIATVNVCAGTQGGGTTYTAGTGLVLVGTEFNIDSSVMQTGDNISELNNDVGYITGISNVDSAETTHIQVKNKEGSTLDAGTPVYIDGALGDNTILEVKKADASNSAKMPAVGILQTQLANNGEGYATVAGFIGGLDTSSAFVSGTPTVGATVYVGVGGGMTTVKPTGNNELIQNVGKLGKVTGDGTMVASCIMRSNDVPNSGDFNVVISDQVTSSNGSFVSLQFGNDNITFPVADGTSGQYLETNGDGVLEWVSADSDANTFVTGVTYSDTTRVVTLLRNDGTNLTAHLDGLATSGDLSSYVEISNLSGSISGFASSGDNVSIFVNDSGYINAHPTVDAASSSDNAGQVFIQDLLFDEFGHVTGVSTATASDDNTTYTAGDGLDLTGTEFSVDDTVVRTNATYENPSWLTSINANILSGEVPSANLPSYVDDVLEYNGTGNFPATGETGKIYLDTSTNFSYRWGGSTYVQIVDGKATWGGIDGTLSNQTDLWSALQAKASNTDLTSISGDVAQNRTWIGANTTSGVALSGRITANDTDISNLSGLVSDNTNRYSALSGVVEDVTSSGSTNLTYIGQNTASGLQNQTDISTLSGLIDDVEANTGLQEISHSWNNTTAQLVSTLTPGNTAVQQLFNGKLYGDASVTYLKSDVDLGIGVTPTNAELEVNGNLYLDKGAGRPVKLHGDSTGFLTKKGDVGGWQFSVDAIGNSGTVYKGYGFYGSDDDLVWLWVGGSYDNPYAKFTTSATVFNETAQNRDFRVEGLTNENLFLVDASTDGVIIGNNTDGGVNSKLHIYEANNTNTTNSRTLSVLGRQYSTSDGTYYHIGGQFRAEKYLSDSVNDTGYVIGTNSVPVVYGDGTSTTLTEITAVRANMSINTAASGVTVTNAFDIKCVPSLAGTNNTVTNHYGLFIQQGAGSATVTNRYGVYQQDPNASNIFLGNVGIGATNLASHDLVVNGTSKFDSQVIVDSRVSTKELIVSPDTTTLPLGIRTLLENTTRVETLNVNGEYTFPTTDGTASGQVLVTDGNGSVAWEDQAGGGTSNVDRATLSLTSGQQTFNVSNGYDTGAIDVYLNGVKLADGTDFTATNGTSFVLTEAAVSGDIVQYTTYDRLTTNGLVSDSGDTMTGDLTINANLAVTGTIDNDGIAFAWVRFDGTQAASSMIDKSYNVTSITDNGVGRYLVNFENAASDADYSAVASSSGPVNVAHCHAYVGVVGIGSNTASSVNIALFNDEVSGRSADGKVHVQVFGGS